MHLIFNGNNLIAGLGYDVVVKLVADFVQKNHHVYADNYFTSYKLAADLLQNGTYLCGTIVGNRKNLPEIIKKPGNMQRGDIKVRQNGGVFATVWKDNREVCTLF